MTEQKKTVLEKYIKFDFRKEKNILVISCKEEELPYNEELIILAMNSYIKFLQENKNLFVITDVRILKTLQPSVVWDKIGKYNMMLKPLVEKNLKASCLLLTNKTIKILVNSLINVYPPIVPFRICNNFEEAIKFKNSQR